MKTLKQLSPIFIVFLFMIFGYAQLSDTLMINGNASLSSSPYELQIVRVEEYENVSNAEINSLTFLGTVLNSTITLGTGGDSALSLAVTVKNNTSDKTFSYSKIIVSSAIDGGYTNENIIFKAYEEYPAKELQSLFYEILPMQEKTFYLVFSYKNNTVPADMSLSSVLNIEFIEKLAVLPGETTAVDSSTSVSTSISVSTSESSSPSESSASSSATSASTTATSGPSAEAGTNFNKVITTILNPEMKNGLNAPDAATNKKNIIHAFDDFEIVHCQRKNAGSIPLDDITASMNAGGAEHIHFIATKTSDTTIEFFLYYEADIEKPLGTNIIVYRQFLVKIDGLWETNGAYEGYAPLRTPTGYTQNNKVVSIIPEEWIPGAIPILDE